MDCEGDILFETVLRPNPPLTPRVLKAVLIAVVLFNLAFAAFFVAQGAWPVAPFLGLDVILLAWALKASTNKARREEQLTLTHSVLAIFRRPEEAQVLLNPYWLRVEAGPASGILLWSHGKSVAVGRFLGLEASSRLAEELKGALWRAKYY